MGTRSATSFGQSLGRAVSRWRGGRLLHPRGRSFEGHVELWGGLAGHVATGPGRFPATIRLSRGVPTPEGWPDVLGLAIRIHTATRPVDLLVSSAGRPPVLRHLPLPRRDFAGPYSSILSYRRAGRRCYLSAEARPLGARLDAVAARVRDGAVVFVLSAASATGRWVPFGQATLREPLPATADAALAFDPIGNHPTGLLPAGLIQRTRAVAYAVSRRSRGAGEQHGPAPGEQHGRAAAEPYTRR
ncbi:phosphodiesterase [Micromonospora sp. NPDC049559]|uniref:phosphodiesterase n=1 Tax=Micromonospora sp. NPDC049559 TaxID=3155923 RepID=UPI00341C6756